MLSPEEKNKSIREKISSLLIRAGCFLLLAAVLIFIWDFAPVLKLELNYQLTDLIRKLHFSSDNQEQLPDFKEIFGTDNNGFYIDIPKIEAHARIVPDVDPYDINVYAKAVANGIAHAAGTALPGHNGNTFLFAHSGRNFYDNSGQNVQFYLLDKMTSGDLIYIYYQGKTYTYETFEVKRVWPSEINYLTDQNFDHNQLTLMSCWPAGVSYQRQLVLADLIATSQ